MFFIIFPIVVLMGSGLYLILADVFRVPTFATTKAVIAVTRSSARRARSFEAILYSMASKIAPFVLIGTFRKRKMTSTLMSAGIHMTPETYIARAILKALLVLLIIIPCLYVIPILASVPIFLAVGIFWQEYNAADLLVRQKREAIESELPRFVNTLLQELLSGHDVLGIFERYLTYAGATFLSELEICITDMRSGSLETALVRFETRVGSTHLSEVVRGLLAVVRGDSGLVYFEMLARDLKLLEIQKLKMIAMKRPGKVKKYSFLMLGTILAMYFTVIIVEAIKTFNKLM